MRISDWSSDVCSSDLDQDRRRRLPGLRLPTARRGAVAGSAGLHGRAGDPSGDARTRTAPRDPWLLRAVRKSVVSGTRVSVRVDPGGVRTFKKNNTPENVTTTLNN